MIISKRDSLLTLKHIIERFSFFYRMVAIYQTRHVEIVQATR